MDKKEIRKYLVWFLALAAIVFTIAGWYYTGGAQKVEGFFSGNSGTKESLTDTSNDGTCSVGTCG